MVTGDCNPDFLQRHGRGAKGHVFIWWGLRRDLGWCQVPGVSPAAVCYLLFCPSLSLCLITPSWSVFISHFTVYLFMLDYKLLSTRILSFLITENSYAHCAHQWFLLLSSFSLFLHRSEMFSAKKWRYCGTKYSLVKRRRESSVSAYLQSLDIRNPENMSLQRNFSAEIYTIADSNLYGCRTTWKIHISCTVYWLDFAMTA